ncbi:HPP family protein [Candidatus Neptunochlamydia vexilliferae]|uniref:CBS domain-containing protein n=1 Tax=Candidatus Neptunichlamydia vexilliferae TaxID=1651774 RepID=A0ABS0AYY2_9BACT|nr:CBS domain-containing protein [Candidatus Neptunochlamydia vexilliferae]MBF5058686.1 hypothetical protein [Candidatus Neptunochlamydia vexilliferae]
MFFVNNVYGGREPYRVQPIERDRSKDDRPRQQFQDEDEEETRENFLKASKKLYKKKSVVTIAEIMSKKLVELEEGLSLKEAWERIKGHKIKHFPLVNSEGKLLGMLTEGEILRELQEGGKKTLKELVSEHTLCADPETEVSEAIQVFTDHSIEAVPVVDAKEKVVGILTQNELLQTMIKMTHIFPK